MRSDHTHFTSGDTEERAKLMHALRRQMGASMLRYALTMLMMDKPTPGPRVSYIYEALSAASNIGYECGIRVFDGPGGEPDIYAVIALPTGAIGFALSEYNDNIFVFEPDGVREIAQAHLGDD